MQVVTINERKTVVPRVGGGGIVGDLLRKHCPISICGEKYKSYLTNPDHWPHMPQVGDGACN